MVSMDAVTVVECDQPDISLRALALREASGKQVFACKLQSQRIARLESCSTLHTYCICYFIAVPMQFISGRKPLADYSPQSTADNATNVLRRGHDHDIAKSCAAVSCAPIWQPDIAMPLHCHTHRSFHQA